MLTTPHNGETAAHVTRDIIIHYKDRLYRLALLVTGSPSAAAERLIAAFANLSPTATDPELDLARALLPSQGEKRRPLRWLARLKRSTEAWKPDLATVGRANLSADKARTLLKVLADASPEARLQLGLHTLLGLPADAVAIPEGAALPEPGKTIQSSIEALIELRCTAALALEHIPATTERTMVLRIARFLAGRLEGDAAVRARALLLSSAKARAVRDGLLATDSLLQRALPLLYAATPPPDLNDRLLDNIDKPHSRTLNPKQLRFLAVGGVALIVLLLLIIPEFTRNQSRGAASVMATATLTPDELVETAIHRFEHPPVQQGLLHEVFAGELYGQRWSLERWYDYDSPNRVKVVVTAEEADQTMYALATDGESQVQFRLRYDLSGSRVHSVGLDVTTSAQELAAFLPTLRQQPDFSPIGRPNHFAINPLDLGHFYLAQASNAELATLGGTNIDGREAQMVTYTTDQPFPPHFERFGGARNTPPEPAPSQIILTIDLQTYTLLDVAVVAQSDSTAIVQHPWRATTVTIEAITPTNLFTLTPADTQLTYPELFSVRFPHLYSFDQTPLSLDEALRVTDETIYIPSQLPDPAIRGAVFNSNREEWSVFYEGPFHSLIVVRDSDADFANSESEERVANGFRYRLVRAEEVPYPDMHLVVINPPNNPTDTIIIAYIAPYESPQTAEATLDTLIGSLQALTEENLNTLGQHFYQPNGRGAQANPRVEPRPRP
ncbi:MAG: hypothetical protein MI924_01380 [Chloroflexales bacterium]|nr:hypothetical protein [Chloroflexales bacterium]